MKNNYSEGGIGHGFVIREDGKVMKGMSFQVQLRSVKDVCDQPVH
jgi:hypothetical protein